MRYIKFLFYIYHYRLKIFPKFFVDETTWKQTHFNLKYCEDPLPHTIVRI